MLVSRRVSADQDQMENDQVAVEAQYDDADYQRDPVDDGKVLQRHKANLYLTDFLDTSLICIVLETHSEVQRVADERNLKKQSGQQCAQHPQKARIVVQPDIVVDPEAVMVEFVGAPVALHAVLRVLQHIAVADCAVVRVVLLSEVDEFVLTARPESLK